MHLKVFDRVYRVYAAAVTSVLIAFFVGSLLGSLYSRRDAEPTLLSSSPAVVDGTLNCEPCTPLKCKSPPPTVCRPCETQEVHVLRPTPVAGERHSSLVVVDSLYSAPEVSEDELSRSHGKLRLNSSAGSFVVEITGPSLCAPGYPATFRVQTTVVEATRESIYEPEHHAYVNCSGGVFLNPVLKWIGRDRVSRTSEHVFEVYPPSPSKCRFELYFLFSDVSFILSIVRSKDENLIRLATDEYIGKGRPALVADFEVVDTERPCKGFVSNELSSTWKRVGRDEYGGEYILKPAMCSLPSGPSILSLLPNLSKKRTVAFFGDSMFRTTFMSLIEHMVGFSPAFPFKGVRVQFCNHELFKGAGTTWDVPLQDGRAEAALGCQVEKGSTGSCLNPMPSSYLSVNLQLADGDGCRSGRLSAVVTITSEGSPVGSTILDYYPLIRSEFSVKETMDSVRGARKYDLIVYNVGLHDMSIFSAKMYSGFLEQRAQELNALNTKVLILGTWAQNSLGKKLRNDKRLPFNGFWAFSASQKRTRRYNEILKETMTKYISKVSYMDQLQMTLPLATIECFDGVHYNPAVTRSISALWLHNINALLSN